MSEKNKPISWKNRESNLREIKRYHKFKTMFYRTDDLIHSKRVKSMVIEYSSFIKELYPEYDVKKAAFIATHHDDHEIVMEKGDIPLQLKLMMNEEELNDLHSDELAAVDLVSQYYPKKVGGYFYKNILLHAVYKDCIEAQFVSFVDKIDGYCEALHEVMAGNNVFLEPIINYNIHTFNKVRSKYYLLEKAFESEHNFFNFEVVDLKEFFQDGEIGPAPHSVESIKRKTLIHHYEEWKRITIKNFGVNILINQTEFHKNNK